MGLPYKTIAAPEMVAQGMTVASKGMPRKNARLTKQQQKKELKAYDDRMFRRARRGVVGTFTNLPTKAGKKATIFIYRVAQRLVKFN